MRLLWWSLATVFGLALVLAAAGIAASELGAEVVTLRTHDGAATTATHLWIIDDAGHAWLRAGSPRSGWFRRLEAHPDVVVDRGGRAIHARATPVPDPRVRDRVNLLMREKYGLADRVVGVLVALTGGDRARSVPVRLDPAPPSR
jgi:hypothetical protein